MMNIMMRCSGRTAASSRSRLVFPIRSRRNANRWFGSFPARIPEERRENVWGSERGLLPTCYVARRSTVGNCFTHTTTNVGVRYHSSRSSSSAAWDDYEDEQGFPVGDGEDGLSWDDYDKKDLSEDWIDEEIEDDDSPLVSSDLDGFTVLQLKESCRQHGLKVSGRKQILIDRLVAKSESIEVSSAAAEANTEDESDHAEFYSSDDDESYLSDDDESYLSDDEDAHVEPPPPPPPNEFCFDKAANYKLVHKSSLEDRTDDMILSPAMKTVDETDALLQLLPLALRESDVLSDMDHRPHLMEVVLDVGRQPSAWIRGERHFLSDQNLTEEDVQHTVHNLSFGSDNRAGIDGSLHRISAIRSRSAEIVGATLRVGRYFPGNALLIADILYNTDASILFVGPPGSCKTSIIRDAAKLLAETHSVVIVDTSNEIGGAGNIPHACIGMSRRMQVQTIEEQAKVMVECVQNHTPSVMVIDEVGRPDEVKAALTCKERGVRIIASAHGDLAGLVRNAALCDLVGGVDVVTVGDKTALQDARRFEKHGTREPPRAQKLRAERRGPPIFDVVIELKRGYYNKWRIVLNTAAAVDSILSTGQYQAQMRTRTDEEGTIQLHHVREDTERSKIIDAQLHNSDFSSAMNKMYDDTPDPSNSSNSNNNETYDDKPDPYRKTTKTCPACNKRFKSRRGMLQHATTKNSCMSMLDDELRRALLSEENHGR